MSSFEIDSNNYKMSDIEFQTFIKSVREEVEEMKVENEDILGQLKDDFFEQKKLFKNISMKDYVNVMKLEENKDELRDFDFIPKDAHSFVRVIDKQHFVNKQQAISVNNLNV